MGTAIVLAILIGIIILAVRSIYLSRKKGGGCTGDCATCGHCRD